MGVLILYHSGNILTCLRKIVKVCGEILISSLPEDRAGSNSGKTNAYELLVELDEISARRMLIVVRSLPCLLRAGDGVTRERRMSMQIVRFSLMAVLLLTILPAVGQVVGQGQPTA